MIIRNINIPRHMLADAIRSCKIQFKQDEEDFQHYDLTLCFSNGATTQYSGHHAEDILKSNPEIDGYVSDIIRKQVNEEFKIDRKPKDYPKTKDE
jgi:hypothetical protein